MNAMTSIAAITANSTLINPLADRAMLVGVKISHWTARKLDKKATKFVSDGHEARRNAGRYNKLLIDKAALKKIITCVNAARAAHYERTFPGRTDGLRILPAMAFDAYSADMRRRRQEFEAEIEDFAAKYPGFILEPRSASASSTTRASSQRSPASGTSSTSSPWSGRMPDAADFRVKSPSSQSEKIKETIEADMRKALESAMADAWRRINEKVGLMVRAPHQVQPGAGEGGRAEGQFRASMVQNVRDLVEVLPSFNLTQDPVLDQVIAAMKRDLCGVDVETLRENSAQARRDRRPPPRRSSTRSPPTSPDPNTSTARHARRAAHPRETVSPNNPTRDTMLYPIARETLKFNLENGICNLPQGAAGGGKTSMVRDEVAELGRPMVEETLGTMEAVDPARPAQHRPRQA